MKQKIVNIPDEKFKKWKKNFLKDLQFIHKYYTNTSLSLKEIEKEYSVKFDNYKSYDYIVYETTFYRKNRNYFVEYFYNTSKRRSFKYNITLNGFQEIKGDVPWFVRKLTLFDAILCTFKKKYFKKISGFDFEPVGWVD